MNLSQQQLITELDAEDVIYQTNISEYEAGRREPPLPILFKYARLARIGTDVLIDDKTDLPSRFQGRIKPFGLRRFSRHLLFFVAESLKVGSEGVLNLFALNKWN